MSPQWVNEPVTSTASAPAIPEGYEDVPHERVKLKLRRRAIARNLTVAATIPSLTADVRVDMGALMAVRTDWNARTDDRLSVLSFLITAAVATLTEFPDLNATFLDTEIVRWQTVNLGIAVDTPTGLVVPTIRNAQTRSVSEIAAQIRDLGLRARDGGIRPEELAGGTFTVSNPGAVGPSIRAEALLNPPQVALLGFPGVSREPTVVPAPDGVEAIEIRSLLRPSLTFDHRAIDGGQAIRYLVSFRDKVETWTSTDYQLAD